MKKILKATGLFSLFYYALIISYAGIQTTFSVFWLFSGTICIGLSGLPKRILGWIKYPMSIFFALFLFQEYKFLSMARSKPEPGADYVIILGAQVKGRRPSRSLLRRIEAGAAYLHQNPQTWVIASGGRGKDEEITEAECIKNTLIEMGIYEDRILMESASVSTWENLQFSMNIGGDDKTYVIVTNGFHLYRAVRTAGMIGMSKVSGMAAKSEPVLLLNYYVREFFAYIAYRRRRR